VFSREKTNIKDFATGDQTHFQDSYPGEIVRLAASLLRVMLTVRNMQLANNF
jgi:hypothetical protein